MKHKKIGKKQWVFAGGHIPLESNGKEPEYLSKDMVYILNTTKKEATIKMTFYFTDQAPAGEYELKVEPERLRMFHVNDLIDPHALPLGVPYGGILQSNVPVVVQVTKQHTGQAALALMNITAYPVD